MGETQVPAETPPPGSPATASPPGPAERDAAAAELVVIRRYVGLLVLIVSASALYFAKQVVLPFILGLLIALTLKPLTRAAARVGIPPVLTAIVLVAAVSAAVVLGAYALSGPIAGWIEQAPTIRAELEQRLRDVAASLRTVREASEQVENIAEATTADPSVLKVAIQQPGFLASTMRDAASLVTTVLVALVLALFLLASGDMFYIKLVESFPRFGDKRRALNIAYGIEENVSRYLLSITLINAGLGLVVGLGLWAVGMPNPGLWGTMAFLFNFLPYVGAAVGAVLIAAVSIITFETLTQALLAPAFFLLATSVEGYFVTPVVLGRRFELNAVFVFATVVFWGWMWGVAGALMAVPFLVCLKVLCDHISRLAVLGNFLGSSEQRGRFDPLRDEEG